ncbi:ABC transporter substrate-binding protein [Aquibium sp. A9E412]|uniref:ABC transporter substrate-binding protein n=1 Tax=Aquibium sp. A9E412 TaxID=2976767 RepID=UPI0025AFCB2C|nr:ABC transporter substrate-binding protein [Aquibium sp. A9E412]MDN2567632.1 ABC transporter substrate-binding protein [Aquibium sp. A9E412]
MTRLTRRSLLASAVLVPLIGGMAAAQDDVELVFAGSGGGLAQVMDAVFDKPFEEETGIRIKALATTDRASAMRAMMEAGNPIWDVAELTPVDYATASLEGWLEPIDWATVDPDNRLPEQARLDDAGIAATYSTILAQRTDKLPEGLTMTSWADFWDVETFPGPRALQDSVLDNLEFALIADGVAPDAVYEVLASDEGVDRAFAKLDEIKPHIVAWWTSGAQPVQMLSDGEVHFTSAWNGRITQLQAEGVPVEAVWNGGGLKPSYIGVLKGTEHKEQAMRYVSFMLTDPARAAQFAKLVSYPGMVKGLYDHLPEEEGRALPTHPDNVENQFVTDAVFWAKNMDALQERWEEWLLQ